MRILTVVTREMCYMSCSFFLDKMTTELEKLGATVDVVDVSAQDASYDVLERYVGGSYDIVLGMNSRLPMLELDNGHLLLDEMGAPLFNYILDHPLFHHAPLMVPIEKGVAIGIDKNHCDYIGKYYPHYKYVYSQTIPGTPSIEPRKWADKEIDILFTGTYESPEIQMQQIEQKPGELRDMMLAAIALMRETGCTQEQALEVLRPDETNMALLMNKCYLIDKYMRNYLRENILTQIAKAGLPLTIVGEGWEKSKLSDYENVAIHEGVEITHSFEIIARSRILLDVNPLFPVGVHDRVPTAFANDTVICTNQNPIADPDIVDGENAIYYRNDNVDSLCDRLDYHLTHEKRAKELADAGLTLYNQKYTWERFGQTLYGLMNAPMEF